MIIKKLFIDTTQFLTNRILAMRAIRIPVLLLASCLLPLASGVFAQPDRFLPGRDFTVIENPLPDRTPDAIEVTAYFWYGCPGCFQFEPQLANWIEKQDESVICLRLPAIWDDWREVHARAYYVARSLGALVDMHMKIFNAMHLQDNRLRDKEELKQLFAEHGTNEADFNKAYNSFTVNSEINRAKNQAIQAGARSTPSLIVNGKYLVALSQETLDIVDFLVNKEKALL
ncbi:MAG: thiol:disulfide interchange protein DsbA/DsbL [Gammaproteobacteria bacterium]|nr:thiol:disulfide interchange protein DsbA/DsbL [Gammaproteobacteria bacterium]